MQLRSDQKYLFEDITIYQHKRSKTINTITYINAVVFGARWIIKATVNNQDTYVFKKGFIVKNDSLKLIVVENTEKELDVYVELAFFNENKTFINKILPRFNPEKVVLCRNLDDYFVEKILSKAKSFQERQEEKKEILESIING